MYAKDSGKSGVIPFRAQGTVNIPVEQAVQILKDHQKMQKSSSNFKVRKRFLG